MYCLKSLFKKEPNTLTKKSVMFFETIFSMELNDFKSNMDDKELTKDLLE